MNKYYSITYRDRSDKVKPQMAIFFMVYNRETGTVVWESATYYSDKEMEKVAAQIVSDFENGKVIKVKSEQWLLNPANSKPSNRGS